MTKPKIPKEIPKERPKRISPGIPVIPKREPDYTPEPREVPEPKKPEEVPAGYNPYSVPQNYALFNLGYTPYRKYRQQVY